jgi:hypothetical protein
MGRARPTAVGRKARRRSSTSATKTVHEHDRSDHLIPDLPSRCSLARIPPGGRGPLLQSASGTFVPGRRPFPSRPEPYRSRAPIDGGRPSPDAGSGGLARAMAETNACAPACTKAATPAEGSRVRDRTGVGPPGAFGRDCSRSKLRPDPIGSDTCCREARHDAGWRGRLRRARTCIVRP